MRDILNLGITTKEGFSVRNLKRFPSMEYGEDGGLQADLYYGDTLLMTIFNAGYGGSAIAYTKQAYNLEKGKFNDLALKCLRRLDENYDKYDFLKKKTVSTVDDDDFEAVVLIIESKYDEVNKVKDLLTDEYKAVAVLQYPFELKFLRYKVDDITVDEVKDYCKNNFLAKGLECVKLYTKKDNLEVF